MSMLDKHYFREQQQVKLGSKDNLFTGNIDAEALPIKPGIGYGVKTFQELLEIRLREHQDSPRLKSLNKPNKESHRTDENATETVRFKTPFTRKIKVLNNHLQPSVKDNNIQHTFLKKGEGLKRFAAFKVPISAPKSISRRQTFVKFKVDGSGTECSDTSQEVTTSSRGLKDHEVVEEEETPESDPETAESIPETPDSDPETSESIPEAPESNPESPKPRRYNLRHRPLASPKPGNSYIAFARQIDRIQKSVDELQRLPVKCVCGRVIEHSEVSQSDSKTTSSRGNSKSSKGAPKPSKRSSKTLNKEDSEVLNALQRQIDELRKQISLTKVG